MFVDIGIIILLVLIILRGREIGLVRQIGSAVGFVGGLMIGVLLQPQAMAYANTTLSRALLSLVVTLTCAFALMTIGEYLGILLKRRIVTHMPLNKADAILGAAAGAVTLLGAIWLLTPVVSSLPSPGLQQAIKNSAIIRGLASALPSAPEFVSRIDRIINPNGFPDVFAGLERKPLDPDAPLPDLGDFRSAVEQTRASIVKLEGRGCGGVVNGSGFVAANNTVITNAHVVAGVEDPNVVDTNGVHSATVIWFDPELDMAVVRTRDNLAGEPLELKPDRLPNGSPGVVVGYPGGGGFTARPATILDNFVASGRDIYGRGNTDRDIYELRADVVPGNSGGPLLNAQGQVVGLIFAESTTYEEIAYALTLQPVVDGFEQAIKQNRPVATGACAG